MPTKNVRILNGALDEDKGRLVLRGALDPETLEALQVDKYQRGVQPSSTLTKIMQGFEPGGSIPDIELGMRGTRRNAREGAYTLLDPVYIMDGLQRVSAAKIYLASGKVPYFGAKVTFSSDFEFERSQFKILNADRTRVSANVLFGNERFNNEAVEMIYNMCQNDDQLVLKCRVCWEQRHGRMHLVTAAGLGRVIAILHSHLNHLSSPAVDAEKLAGRVRDVSQMVGKNVLRHNIRTFYEIMDECWGVKRVVYAEKAPFIKLTFLLTMAKVLSNHEIFWRENRLLMEVDLRRKLAKFKAYDPTVVQLASTGAKVDPVLYKMIVDQFNWGKRTRRLRERCPVDIPEEAEVEQAGTLELAGAANP